MTNESTYLLALARRNASVYQALPGACAGIVAGSVALGTSDRYSDIDTCFYYTTLPTIDELDSARRLLVGASEPHTVLGSHEAGTVAQFYTLHGVECQVIHYSLAALEAQIASIHTDLDVKSPNQKALSGILECVALFGDDVVNGWKTRLAEYPDTLRTAMITAHLSFFPLWNYDEWLQRRDTIPWHYQNRVEIVYNLLGTLAGVNRLYFTSFQLKHTKDFIAKMAIAPPTLHERLTLALTSNSDVALPLLKALVSETLQIVETHAPTIDTKPAWRQWEKKHEMWSPIA
jgi:hypothetical protein